MKKSIFLLITLSLLTAPICTWGKVVSLTESCLELINIYKSKKEKKFLAAQTTSLTESLRAGYCLGVIEQFAESRSQCRSDWYKRAKFIAGYARDNNPPTEQKLLRLSCEI